LKPELLNLKKAKISVEKTWEKSLKISYYFFINPKKLPQSGIFLTLKRQPFVLPNGDFPKTLFAI